MGSRGSGSGRVPNLTYERFPYSTLWKGGGTKEERAQVTKTVSDFIKNAQAGDVYRLGGGFGSGGSEMEIIERGYGLSASLYIKQERGNPLKLSRENVKRYISNGAKLIKRKKKKKKKK